MALKTPPAVRQQMLIRKPVAEVFRAFVDPSVTTKFWFTKSSGPLEPGKTVRWDWEMYGVSTEARVDAIAVEWLVDARADGTTLVRVSNRGFAGDDDEQVAQALDSMGGFSLLLAGAK